jgi:transcriptional regulator with XRE-family HTH domain
VVGKLSLVRPQSNFERTLSVMASSFGTMLREKRERQGLTLRDAAHETRIPVSRLQGLEGDDYQCFGSATYVRGFLKLYSQFLGIAPELVEGQVALLAKQEPRKRVRQAATLTNLLPWGLWGGPRENRTPAKRASVRELSQHPSRARITASPVAAALMLLLISVGASAVWGTHLSKQWAQTAGQKGDPIFERLPAPTAFPPQTPLGVQPQAPAIVKAIPVTEEGLEHLFPQGTGSARAAE